ncbi:hypothetical protein OTB20_39425 [Streptomyces sp. H27-H1]|uniref:hypothetical protein n=1 Tax=Streptomyces sp. H27-H1 TaxID=2996461 RepID=UPI00227120FC|nr:hypothetical protein [Streptomyces sp. H27-H1]MCY0932136.1 hypothetical protein [Streptomyces sp. H27-H1]
MKSSMRIDLAVGQARAAELVKCYRDRLVEQDLIPPEGALRLACQTYADGYVYVTAAPGQFWERAEKEGTGTDLLLVLSLDQAWQGRTALCEFADGEHDELLLEELRYGYTLHSWPPGEGGEGDEPAWPRADGCPG